MGIDSATPLQLHRQTRAVQELFLGWKVECLDGVVGAVAGFENQQEELPAVKYPGPIAFSDSIGELLVQEAKGYYITGLCLYSVNFHRLATVCAFTCTERQVHKLVEHLFPRQQQHFAPLVRLQMRRGCRKQGTISRLVVN